MNRDIKIHMEKENDMSAEKYNTITKADVFNWWQYKRNEYRTEELANLIYRVTVCSEDYSQYKYDMSYICRLYNITEYGASSSQNRIKGRYKKYLNNPKIKEIIFNIIRQNPNGFYEEEPRFDDLLKQYLLNMSRFEEDNDEVPLMKTPHYETKRQENVWNLEDLEESSFEGGQLFASVKKILLVVIVGFLVLKGVAFIGNGIGFIGDGISFVVNGINNIFSKDNFDDYFETYENGDLKYIGELKGGKPRGLCAVYPKFSNGTYYALGEFKGTELSGWGIRCLSSQPLSENKNASLNISMGEMKKNVLNGYGLVWNASKEIIIGEYKDGKLKKYGCKIVLNQYGNIMQVIGVKKDKEKKELQGGSYKGMKYYPESGKIEIDDVIFTISAGKVVMEKEDAQMSVKGIEWNVELFDKKESVSMNYVLRQKIRAIKVLSDTAKYVSEFTMVNN